MTYPQEEHRVSVVAIHRRPVGELHRCSSERVSDPGHLLAQAPGPAGHSSPTTCPREKSDVDDHTRGAAGDAIAEAKIRIQQAFDYLDRYPDNVLSIVSAIALLNAAVQLLECPEEM